jgi:hypothetical protein
MNALFRGIVASILGVLVILLVSIGPLLALLIAGWFLDVSLNFDKVLLVGKYLFPATAVVGFIIGVIDGLNE